MVAASTDESNVHTVNQLLEESLSFEQKTIELYRELAQVATRLEDIALEELAREQVKAEVEHADEVRKMLRKPDAP